MTPKTLFPPCKGFISLSSWSQTDSEAPSFVSIWHPHDLFFVVLFLKQGNVESELCTTPVNVLTII